MYSSAMPTGIKGIYSPCHEILP